MKSASRPRATVARWTVLEGAALVLGICSLALHVLLLGVVSRPAGMAMVVLAVACAWCAVDVWLRPGVRAWAMMLVLSGLMVVLHLALGDVMHAADVSSADADAHEHVGHHEHAVEPSSSGSLMTAVLWLAVVEMVVAFGALGGIAAHRARAVRLPRVGAEGS